MRSAMHTFRSSNIYILVEHSNNEYTHINLLPSLRRVPLIVSLFHPNTSAGVLAWSSRRRLYQQQNESANTQARPPSYPLSIQRSAPCKRLIAVKEGTWNVLNVVSVATLRRGIIMIPLVCPSSSSQFHDDPQPGQGPEQDQSQAAAADSSTQIAPLGSPAKIEVERK